MNRVEYENALILCWRLAQISETIPTQEMSSAISRSEAIAPMIDPTLYIRKAEVMAEDRKIIEAVHVLRTAYLKVKASHPDLIERLS
jgi:hypothetical protein